MNLRSLFAIVAALCTHGTAATITVNNSDFSTNAGATATNWTDLEVGGANVYYNPVEASGIDHVAYIMSSGSSSSPNFCGVIQNLSTFNAGLTASTYNSYTITFLAGFRDDLSQTGTTNMRVMLVDLGVDGVYQATDTALGSQTFTRSGDGTAGQSAMTSQIAQIDFISASANQIGLVFQNENTGATFQQTGMIDNISITAVPEPSIALLGGLGVLALLRRRR